jgi:hypothetical protein
MITDAEKVQLINLLAQWNRYAVTFDHDEPVDRLDQMVAVYIVDAARYNADFLPKLIKNQNKTIGDDAIEMNTSRLCAPQYQMNQLERDAMDRAFWRSVTVIGE